MASLQDAANAAATQYGVPPALYSALITQESNWNPNAVSSAGAIGLAQIMPGNWPSLGIGNPYDTTQNLNGGANLLSQYYKQFGNWYDALRAYNAGPTAAQNSPNQSSGYANSILNAAGLTKTGDTMSTTGTTANNYGVMDFMTGGLKNFLSDPVAFIKDQFSIGFPIIIICLIVIVLIWFGIQQIVKE